MGTIATSRIINFLPKKASCAITGLADLHRTMRHFVLLKYFQVLALPLENRLMLALGALASLYTALLLNSPQASRKASSVLLGQLARADILLVLHWSLRALLVALGVSAEATEGLGHSLLASHYLASLLLLTCVSLEALLVCMRPVETRGLRTVQCARLASTAVWAGVALEFLVLQASECKPALRKGGAIMLLMQWCSLLAPVFQALSFCIRLLLWLVNAWICYTVFCNKPQSRKSCFY